MLTTRLYTLFAGKHIGTDTFGNRYFEARRARGGKRKRWVLFKGKAEPSKVPAEWHGWLHYTLDKPLTDAPRYRWQKDHLPNLTGTQGAYLPPGHLTKAGKHAPTVAEVEAWVPK